MKKHLGVIALGLGLAVGMAGAAWAQNNSDTKGPGGNSAGGSYPNANSATGAGTGMGGDSSTGNAKNSGTPANAGSVNPSYGDKQNPADSNSGNSMRR